MRHLPSSYALALSSLLALTGCAMNSSTPTSFNGAAITGIVHGGQSPIVGAHVYLLAANTTGYGSASRSLLTTNLSGTDSIGGYVVSGAGGSWGITGDYSCSSGDQVYLYATGGNPGSSGSNSAISLMSVLGNCPGSGSFAASDPTVIINEVSTIAAAYVLGGFATDGTHVSSSGTPQALTGVKNAFATAANLADQYGHALATTPSGLQGMVPQAEINTLANILAACINSTDTNHAACTTLFTTATSTGASGGTQPSDTATAAINIAHHPGANVSGLFGIPTGIAAEFGPALSQAPNDFSIGIVWPIGSGNLAIDSAGDIWTILGGENSGVLKLSNNGNFISTPAGYSAGTYANNLAIDPSDNVWITNFNSQPLNSSLVKLSNAGAMLSSGITTGGLNAPGQIAIDGTGIVWVGNGSASQSGTTGTVSGFTNAGTALPGSPFVAGGQANVNGLAVDVRNNLWASSFTTSTASGQTEIQSSTLAKLTAGAIVPSATTTSTTASFNVYASDASNNVWGTEYVQFSSNNIFEMNSLGAPVTGSPYVGNTALHECLQIGIDGLGNAWCASSADSIAAISSTGDPISPDGGYVVPYAHGPLFLAIDSSGNVWTTGDYNDDGQTFINLTVELIGAAAPVVTPTSLAIQMGKLGARP